VPFYLKRHFCFLTIPGRKACLFNFKKMVRNWRP